MDVWTKLSEWSCITDPNNSISGAGDDNIERVPLSVLAEGDTQHLLGPLAAPHRVHGAEQPAVDRPRVQPAATARSYITLQSKHYYLLNASGPYSKFVSVEQKF